MKTKQQKKMRSHSTNGTGQFRHRLKKLTRSGDIVFHARSHFGPLPRIHLTKKIRIDQVVKAAKI